MPELTTDCEILWVKVKLQGRRKLLFCCFYHPHTEVSNSMKAFAESAHRASNINNAIIVAGGDFNLPGWHWPTKTLKKGSPSPSIHRKFMDDINDVGWEQMVQDPTRGEKYLDLPSKPGPPNWGTAWACWPWCNLRGTADPSSNEIPAKTSHPHLHRGMQGATKRCSTSAEQSHHVHLKWK